MPTTRELLRVSVDVTPGRAAWRGVDLSSRRDWVYELSTDEIEELRAVVERVRASGLALDELRREDVPLPFLSPVIDGWADELDAGRGFVLVRGVPVEELGEDGCGDRLCGPRCTPGRAGVTERCGRSSRARPRRRLGPGRSDRASLPDTSGATVPRGRVRRRRVALSAAGQVRWPVADRQLGHRRRGGGPTSPRPGRAVAGAVVLRSLRRGTARRTPVVRDADAVGAAGPLPLRVSALVHRQGPDPLRRTATDGRASGAARLDRRFGGGPRTAPRHGLRAWRHSMAGQPHDPALPHGLRGSTTIRPGVATCCACG